MNKDISCTINGRKVNLNIDISQSLLEVLRDKGYTGVKEGCGVGECGACTVLIDDIPVDSCLYLAVWADNKKIRTVEGEAKNGKLSEVQQAYLNEGAVQCGFCTPGMIMTSTAFVEKNKGMAIDRDLIRREHSGNLCRCTGYESIVRAVESCCNSEQECKTNIIPEAD